MKVSDNVGTDEPEPEVMLDGLHHADEHMSLEMTLAILRWLTEGYGSSTRITNIVDNREIWIVFAMNPDGATYDIKDGSHHWWRKNRQPTSGSTAIGTDLNRNYDYRWGLRRGQLVAEQLPLPGKSAFSAPETRAFRDFVRSRVIDGRQQIRASMSFHDRSPRHVAVRLHAHQHPERHDEGRPGRARRDRQDHGRIQRLQAHPGQQPVHLVGHVAGLAVRPLSRSRTHSSCRQHALPKASAISSETGRNKNPVLYLLERAGCPYGVIGKEQSRCGAFDDDLEVARGWTVNPLGTDTATGGKWIRANPEATSSSGPKQLGTVPSGSAALVTAYKAGSSASAYDVDGGTTTVQSSPIALPDATGQRLTFRYYLAHASNASSADELRVSIVADGGATTTVFLEQGAANDDDAAWASASIALDDWAGSTVRIRIGATDGGPSSLVEAAVDDVRVTRS